MMTIREENKQRQIEFRNQAMELLQISKSDYYHIQFELAEAYLMNKFENRVEFVKIYMKEPAFWSWWRNQYMLIDEQYVKLVCRSNPINLLRYGYIKEHVIPDGAFPDRVIQDKIIKNRENVAT